MKQSTKLSTAPYPCDRCTPRLLICAGLLLGIFVVGVSAAEQATAPGPGEGATAAADLVARAQAGDRWAQLNLGAAFDQGAAGFPLDPVRAVAWYRRAAESGLAEAQFNLAHCLATGNGVARNDREALGWMLKAAEQGLDSAQFLAGVMLAEGIGAAADRERALGWLQRAADNGNSDATSMLDRMSAVSTAD